MLEITITPKKLLTAGQLQNVCMALGLTQTLKGTLRTIAANTHWHYKKGTGNGILEVTLLHASGEVLLSVHENRQADWIWPAIRELQKRIEGEEI